MPRENDLSHARDKSTERVNALQQALNQSALQRIDSV
jgi:hypothetical protein